MVYGTSRRSGECSFLHYRKTILELNLYLKWNQNAQTAIRQIKNRQYPEAVANYTDNILLVGISYDKKQKTHNCLIEKHSEKQ